MDFHWKKSKTTPSLDPRVSQKAPFSSTISGFWIANSKYSLSMKTYPWIDPEVEDDIVTRHPVMYFESRLI
jgi:hypothetical protein